MKKGKKITMIFSLFWTIILLVSVTYSWISRSWTPKLEYPKIAIATTGALIITFENDEVYNEVNLNELTNIEEFALKQVSSPNGREFVSADFSPILEKGVPVYDNRTANKYIQTEFWLKTQYESNDDLANRSKEIFLSNDSYIKYDYTDENEPRVDLAIRISIEIQNGPTYILCTGKDGDVDGLDGTYTKKAASLDAIDKPIFENYPETELKAGTYESIIVYDLKYFNGEPDDYGINKNLLTIDSSSGKKVTVRIWLEGCDENCVNEIAGEKLSICLKFDSREVIKNTNNETNN